MQRIKRKLTVTITKSCRQVITERTSILRLFCPFCERDVETLEIHHAALLLKLEGGKVDRLVANDMLHAMQTVSGVMRICIDSLFAEIQPEDWKQEIALCRSREH